MKDTYYRRERNYQGRRRRSSPSPRRGSRRQSRWDQRSPQAPSRRGFCTPPTFAIGRVRGRGHSNHASINNVPVSGGHSTPAANNVPLGYHYSIWKAKGEHAKKENGKEAMAKADEGERAKKENGKETMAKDAVTQTDGLCLCPPLPPPPNPPKKEEAAPAPPTEGAPMKEPEPEVDSKRSSSNVLTKGG